MPGKSLRGRMPRIGLLGRFSLLSLLVTALLGVVLAATLESQIRARAIQDSSSSAQLVARFGIQPQLSSAALKDGLSPEAVAALDDLLGSGLSGNNIVEMEVQNRQGKVMYSNRHGQIGLAHVHEAFQDALAGQTTATVVDDLDERPAGQKLVETHAPLRLNGSDHAADG